MRDFKSSCRSEVDFILETLVKSVNRSRQLLVKSAAPASIEVASEDVNVIEEKMDTESENAAPPPEARKLQRLVILISSVISFKEGALVTPTQILNLQNLFIQVRSVLTV